MGCECDDCDRSLPVALSVEWGEFRLMASLKKALIIGADAGQSVAIADVKLVEDQDAAANCG